MSEVEQASPEPDSYVCERVRRALAADPRVGELGITVRVVGRRAFVSGSVATPERRQAISTVVTEVLPAYEVQNDVAVTPLEPGSEIEMLG